ncbi:glycosyltransferase family 2 protein [Dysgonomonas termitidis]|uniref:Glycosyltransferase family 2 protein n=1 Tax=Dysgonomonas termitidis TaxID=1516126 RepID=A0ABV9L0M1_9BACT
MEHKIPKVSVILPNYNHESYLKVRIDSIVNQTFQDFELIILDDCSTDNSLEIIRAYETLPQVSHVVINEKNSGSTFKQWKKGFELARGKYIWIAESDDYADLTFLEKMTLFLDKDERCTIAFCLSRLVDEKGVVLPIQWSRKMNGNIVHKFEGQFFIQNYMSVKNSIYNASMALFRKSALCCVDKHFMDFRYCGDWFFWNKICIQGNVVRYEEFLNNFRQHLNKVTPKADSMGLKYTEGKYVVADVIEMLDLNWVQQIIVKGCFLKEMYRFPNFKNKGVKRVTIKDVNKFLKSRRFYIYIFRLDRIFNFSGLDIAKNKKL